MFTITYSKAAAKALRRMPKDEATRVMERIEALAVRPEGPEHSILPLKGRPELRLRVGGWRVLFLKDDEAQILLIRAIGPRGDVYK